MYAIVFLLIFAALLVAYGLVIYKTGNVNLIPYRATHSIRDKQDVRRVGLLTTRVGLVLGALLLVALAVVLLTGAR